MIESGKINGLTATLQRVSYLNSPLERYLPPSSTPFTARGLADIKLASDFVDQLPSECRFHKAGMIGQIVQTVKDNMSHAPFAALRHNCPMAEWSSDLEFNEALVARTKRLREDRGWTAEQMATALGIPAERYRKYEYRTPIPHALIERFALTVDVSVGYMLTGKGATGSKGRRVVRTGTED